MLFLRTILVFICSVCVILKVNCSEKSSLHNKIDKLLESQRLDLNIGIYVKDLESGAEKFSIHPNRMFIPASTIKLFTAYAALEWLGKNFKFKTLALADRKINKGILKSDLYLRFSAIQV